MQHNITVERAPRWLTLLVVLYAIAALLGAASTLYTIEVSRWYGPFRDMWEAFDFLRSSLLDGLSLSSLLEQYGYAHRPAIPRLLFVADNVWFSGSNVLLISVSIACQALTLLMWIWQTRRSNLLAISRVTVYASGLLLLFSPTLLFNFLHTFDVQWFTATLSVCVALFLLIRIDRPLAAQVWALLALLPGVLSNFSALAALPVMFCVVMVRRQTWREPMVLCALVAGLLAVYFFQLDPREHTGSSLPVTWSALIHALLYVLVDFPLLYLTSPLSYFVSEFFVLPIIVLVVSWLAWRWWRVLRYAQGAQPFELWCLALALFGYGVGVVTAIGRGYDPGHMFALRYQNIVVLFWLASLTLMLLPGHQQAGHVVPMARHVRGVVAAIVLYAVLYGSMHLHYLDEHILLGNNVRSAHTAIVLGMTDDLQAMRATISRSHLGNNQDYQLASEGSFLREHTLGPFADEIAAAMRNHSSLQASTYPDCAWQWSDRKVLPKGGTLVYLHNMRLAAPAVNALLLFYREDGQLVGAAWPFYGAQFISYVLARIYGTDTYAGILTPLATGEQKLLTLSVADGVACRLVQ